MWVLVHKDFVQARSFFVQVLGIWVVTLAVFSFTGKEWPVVAHVFLTFGSVMLPGLTLPNLSFAQEERGNMLAFLRTLPIRPWEVVASKCVISLAGVLAFVASQWAFSGAGDPSARASLSCVMFLSPSLAAVNVFLNFWLGARAALAAWTAIGAVPALGGLVLAVQAAREPRLASGLLATVRAFAETAASATGLTVSPIAGALMMAVSFLASSRIFAGRDTSRLP